MPTELRVTRAGPEGSSRRLASLIDPNLIAIVQFSVIGLLVMLVAMLCFPNLGLLIAQYNQF